jgi:hypothetical protein
MTLTGKVFAAGALVALIGFPVSSVLAQSSSSMGADASASAPASNSMGAGASASAPAPSSMNDSSASASASGQAAQVDDATLQKAAKAYVKVKQIVHQTKQASPDSATAQADPAAAQSQKIAAVKGEGLDIQQYNQVLQTVQADPQLQQKFASYVTQNGGDTD